MARTHRTDDIELTLRCSSIMLNFVRVQSALCKHLAVCPLTARQQSTCTLFQLNSKPIPNGSLFEQRSNTIVQLTDGLTGRKVDLTAINDRNMTRKTPASITREKKNVQKIENEMQNIQIVLTYHMKNGSEKYNLT